MANEKVTEFVHKQTAHNERQETAISGIVDRFGKMTDLITKLQNSQGDTWTEEDQATLDALDAEGEKISAGLEALASQTPPTPPVV